MPSLDEMRRLNYGNAVSVGQALKQMSDEVMQGTWGNNIQTRTCYIYDYYHDDNPDVRTGYIPTTENGKVEVELKFIIKEYKSASKDEPEYHIQFSPEDWNTQFCVPNYYEKYTKLDINFPIGLYVDIPDDRGVYWKWLIVYDEVANQFPKFGVLKCNYLFRWIYDDGVNRYKRKMWGVEKVQSSSSTGIQSGSETIRVDSKDTIVLPWNLISSEIKHDQRLFVSMLQREPSVYKVSKITNTSPKGIINITMLQDVLNSHTDYVNLETGEMYADYYQSSITPDDAPSETLITNVMKLTCSTAQVKVGGGYKTITATCYNKEDMDITSQYTKFTWNYSIDDKDCTELIQIGTTDVDNKIKIKFLGDESYLGKNLIVKCTSKILVGEIQLSIVAL